MKKKTRAVVAGLTTALALTGGAALPAQAARPQPIGAATYSALGDSYAAGFGAGLPVTPLAQSAEAYPAVLAGGLRKVNFWAVPDGGTTANVAAFQIPNIPRSTQQVTLTVGGNDLGFVDKATACFSKPSACVLDESDRVKLAALTRALSENLDAIHEKAPNAKIFVTGYPLLFQATQTPENNGQCVVGEVTLPDNPTPQPVILSEAQADAMDAAAVALNRTIKSSIKGSMHSYAKYVDVTPAFTGHGLCGTPTQTSAEPNPASWINSVDATVTPQGITVDVTTGPLHPTAAGQQAYASSIRDKGFKAPKSPKTPKAPRT